MVPHGALYRERKAHFLYNVYCITGTRFLNRCHRKNFSVTYGISGIWKSVEKRRHEMV